MTKNKINNIPIYFSSFITLLCIIAFIYLSLFFGNSTSPKISENYLTEGQVLQSNDQALNTVVIQDTDNDWWLPEDVKRDEDAGFYQLSLKNPSSKLPIISPGGWVWSWKDLNPSEGVYSFDKITNKIAEVEGTDYAIGLRIKGIEREFVPDWVVAKHHPSVITFTGGNSSFDVVCPWDPGVEQEYARFLQALKQTGIPQNPKIVFSQIHGFSSSRGEELNLQNEDFNKAVNNWGLTSTVYYNWAKERIDVWVDAFSGVEDKLMWSGHDDSLNGGGSSYSQQSINIVRYALQKGIGFRGGIIEKYYGERLNKPESTGQKLVHRSGDSTSPYYETYFETNLDFPVISQRRANGDENEEYYAGAGTSDTLAQKKHRWLMSNLWSLTFGVRFNYTTSSAYDLNPTFSDYVQKSMGKTVANSADAWVFLNEGYATAHHTDGTWKPTAIKNYERYIYQRDFDGGQTVPVEKVYRGDVGGGKVWGGASPYDYVARRTNRSGGSTRMYFNVEDRFILNQPQDILLKVTYKDVNSGRWHIEYDGGGQGTLSTSNVNGTGDSKWKTATFRMNDAVFGNKLPNNQDLAIVTDNNDVTVKYVRIIKLSSLPPVPSPTPQNSYDLNQDGKVDQTDLKILLTNFNSTTYKEADFNDDGIISGVDYDLLLAHFTEVPPSPSPSPTPLPSPSPSPTLKTLWYSTMNNRGSITNPSIGTSGGSLLNFSGTIFVPGRTGNGVMFNNNAERIYIPTTGNFNKKKGAIDFWYKPNRNHNDGREHKLLVIWENSNNYFTLNKYSNNYLQFVIIAGGGRSVARISPSNYSWRAGSWVKIRIEWDDTVSLGNQQKIFINEKEPTHTDPTADYNSNNLRLGDNLSISVSNTNQYADGVIDEFRIYGE